MRESVKITDEIPFQMSSTCQKLLFPGPESNGQSQRIRTINWDEFSYDFKLEKSVSHQ